MKQGTHEYLYEFITGTLRKEDSQIEKFRRLYEKGYLRRDDMVNLIIIREDVAAGTALGSKFAQDLPGGTRELGDLGEKLDLALLNLFKDYCPKHMHGLLKVMLTGSSDSSDVRTRVLEELLNRGVLTLPLDNQRAGLSTLMTFSAALTEQARRAARALLTYQTCSSAVPRPGTPACMRIQAPSRSVCHFSRTPRRRSA